MINAFRIVVFRMFVCAALLTLPLLVFSPDAQVQAQPVQPGQGAQIQSPAPAAPLSVQEQQRQGDGFNPNDYDSLVFTHWEHIAIEDARRSRGKTRSVSEAELIRDINKRDDRSEKIKPAPEEREIRLSGIVYHSAKDWTLWLNEQRVTPEAIPEEVMDLKVYKTYIEFRWFDDWTNQIFPIRLRPHQRFNIDTRIFLPG
ncbi:MAG: hypothetical protein R3E13_00615 [Alphaproteobacteria bacterium]